MPTILDCLGGERSLCYWSSVALPTRRAEDQQPGMSVLTFERLTPAPSTLVDLETTVG
jgi:hypothetical protein